MPKKNRNELFFIKPNSIKFKSLKKNSKKNLEEKSIKEILKADDNSSKSSSQGSTYPHVLFLKRRVRSLQPRKKPRTTTSQRMKPS